VFSVKRSKFISFFGPFGGIYIFLTFILDFITSIIMKKLLYLSAFLVFISSFKTFAQSDTLVTKKREKIACKILELSETEIKYKKASYIDGPTYTMDKNKLSMIIYANGEKELIKEDELSVNQTAEIIDRRSAVKIEPFSPTMGKFVVGYEHVLKVGMNLEVKVGLINSSMSQSNLYGNNYYTTGGFFKGGVKFLLGQDYYMKGMKYAHPLKGRYIRVDAILTTFKVRDINFNYSTQPINTYGYPTYVTGKTDMTTTAYGLMLNYGRQFILGNIMTLDYYVGLGYAGSTNSYSNSNYPSNRYEYFNSSYYYSHTAISTRSAICINAGLTLGIVFK